MSEVGSLTAAGARGFGCEQPWFLAGAMGRLASGATGTSSVEDAVVLPSWEDGLDEEDEGTEIKAPDAPVDSGKLLR